MAQLDTFGAPENFETPLWATAKRTNSHAWLFPNINATNCSAQNSPESVKDRCLTPMSLEPKAPHSFLYVQ